MLYPGNGDAMDRADLQNLRVLIVGGKPHAVTTLRTIFGIIGLTKVYAAAESARAIQFLRDQPVHAVFCDETAGEVDHLTFPMAARRAPGLLNPMLPIFLVCGSPVRPQVERARDSGVADVLVRPLSAATVIRKLSVATVYPRSFIVAGDFFGPDRRGAGRLPFGGDDRRLRMPRKIKVAPGYRDPLPTMT